jgi:hypothetical protein
MLKLDTCILHDSPYSQHLKFIIDFQLSLLRSKGVQPFHGQTK